MSSGCRLINMMYPFLVENFNRWFWEWSEYKWIFSLKGILNVSQNRDFMVEKLSNKILKRGVCCVGKREIHKRKGVYSIECCYILVTFPNTTTLFNFVCAYHIQSEENPFQKVLNPASYTQDYKTTNVNKNIQNSLEIHTK